MQEKEIYKKKLYDSIFKKVHFWIYYYIYIKIFAEK